jgi:hypothetical protein
MSDAGGCRCVMGQTFDLTRCELSESSAFADAVIASRFRLLCRHQADRAPFTFLSLSRESFEQERVIVPVHRHPYGFGFIGREHVEVVSVRTYALHQRRPVSHERSPLLEVVPVRLEPLCSTWRAAHPPWLCALSRAALVCYVSAGADGKIVGASYASQRRRACVQLLRPSLTRTVTGNKEGHLPEG